MSAQAAPVNGDATSGREANSRARVRASQHGGGDRSAALEAPSDSPRDSAVMRYLGGLLKHWRTAINSGATVVDRRRDGAEGDAR
jgi:hypothetical protein